MNIKRKNCGLIIIGDEILSGKTLDTNSNFLAKELSNRGVDVKEIFIIGDIEKSIINCVRNFSKKFNFVFTTGGIGPTHDDITSRSISKAFNKELLENKEARGLLEKHYPENELTKARLKMAFMPKDSNLIYNPVSIAPGFFIKNVYVFPGVPKIMEIMFVEFIDKLLKKNPLPQKSISTKLSEGIIGEYVGEIQVNYPNVMIGSYPYFKNNNFGVTLVLKSTNKNDLDKVCDELFSFLKKKKGNPMLF